MRGHNTKGHQHIHTNFDVLWVCCRRLLDEIHDQTTPEGLESAEECYQEQLKRQPDADPSSLLAGKVWSILDRCKNGHPI